jgi:class 3 adenylate cyclase
MELAPQLSVEFLPLMDRALLAGLRRQQELVWTEGLVEHIEDEPEAAGKLGRPGRVPAMVFLDLVSYTRLTEEQGDTAAAQLAQSLALLVSRSARGHGGVPTKWLGDGVMVHFRVPTGALRSALDLLGRPGQVWTVLVLLGVGCWPHDDGRTHDQRRVRRLLERQDDHRA